MCVCVFQKGRALKDMKITDHPSECGCIRNTHQCYASEGRKLLLERSVLWLSEYISGQSSHLPGVPCSRSRFIALRYLWIVYVSG